MELKEYFEKHKLNMEEFCKKTGISRSALYLYRKGKLRPSLEIALVIQKETNGEVTIEDLRFNICDKCKEKMNGKNN